MSNHSRAIDRKSPRAQPASSNFPDGLTFRMRSSLHFAFKRASRRSSSNGRLRKQRFAFRTRTVVDSACSLPNVRSDLLLPTYRNPQRVHSTSGPSSPFDSRTNRGFSAPHTSQETYGFEFSMQPYLRLWVSLSIPYGGQLRQCHKIIGVIGLRRARTPARLQTRTEGPRQFPRSRLQSRTILQ